MTHTTPEGDAERVARRAEIAELLRNALAWHGTAQLRAADEDETQERRLIAFAHADECREKLEIELTRLTSALAAREGYVLVPVEPTVEMVEAGRAQLSQGDAKVQTHARVMWVWEAMVNVALAARPTPEVCHICKLPLDGPGGDFCSAVHGPTPADSGEG